MTGTMTCRYEFTFDATCPVDPETVDNYEAVVLSPHMLRVEFILEQITAITAEPLYQEQITEALARVLCAEVTTRGIHSSVGTVCTADYAVPTLPASDADDMFRIGITTKARQT